MVVPEGWEQKSLQELFNFSGGVSASRADLSNKGFPYLHYGDIHGALDTFIDVCANSSIPRLKVDVKRLSSSSLLNDGDVVFVDASEDDEGASRHIIIRNSTNTPFIAGLHTIVAKSKADILDNAFKEFCFQTAAIKQQFKFYAGGTKVKGISKNNIRRIMLLYPKNKNEQRRIAEVLSDTDAYIHSLKKLIAKKEAVKQGVMQELLTGKKRLPGFSGEWVEKRLGEVSEIVMGQSPQSHSYSYNINGLPLIQGNTNIKNRKTVAEIYTSHITKIARTGDIILTVRAPVGVVGRATFNCCMGRGVCALKGNDFLYHTLIFIEPSWTKLSKGSTFDSVTGQDIYNIFIRMPPTLAEQTAVANILSDMDQEIEALKKKLKKIESIKQRMMQKLLTGEIRLLEETEGSQEDRHYKLKNQDENLYAAEKVESYKTPFIKG